MSFARRVALSLVVTVGLATPSRAQAPASWADDLTPVTPAEWNYQRAAHLLERAGFGGTPAEVERLARMPPAEAVNHLVDYEKVAAELPPFEPSGIYPHGHKLVGLDKVAVKGFFTGKAYGVKATQEGQLTYQPAVNEFYTLLISEHAEMRRAAHWWADRMVRTPRPLEEKLALFWHDHFATSQEKVLNYELMMGQIATLRQHANGNFRALLVAVAQDPAMLIWLDNRENVRGKPNENFAREIMELFCMGEGKGYSENDIREMARAFTGWTMRPVETVHDSPKFVNSKWQHDGGVKTFLGASGKFTGYDAIDIILKQPATPRFLTKKIYRYFNREQLSPELNDKLAAALVGAKYDLKPLLKTILLSRDFYSGPAVGTQIKAPVHYVVSTYRKLGLRRLPGVPDATETTGGLGQVLFYPPNVAGWPGGRSWLNPSTLLVRGNFAHALLFPDPAGYGTPDKVVAEGYRKIPLAFRQYGVQPRLWNAGTGKMEPVSLAAYDRFLAGIDAGAMKAMGGPPETTAMTAMPAMEGPKKPDAVMKAAMPAVRETGAEGREAKSRMAKVSSGERYNLAVGVYTGFVTAYDRVRAIPRTPAAVDFVAMAREAKAATAGDAVDGLCRRFLSVPLQAERRAAVVEFLTGELGGDRLDYNSKTLDAALRRAAHLILCSPEYQLG